MARFASGREALWKYHVLQWNSLKVTHQTFFISGCFDQSPPYQSFNQTPPYKSPSPSCRLSPSPLVISLRGGTGPAPTPTFSEIRSRDQYSTRRARTLVITSQKLKIGHNPSQKLTAKKIALGHPAHFIHFWQRLSLFFWIWLFLRFLLLATPEVTESVPLWHWWGGRQIPRLTWGSGLGTLTGG